MIRLANYVTQMDKAMDQIHSYDGTTWNSDISVTDTSYKLASSLPTQVFKIFDNSPSSQSDFVRLIGAKDYELKDHLGNVRVVISDAKLIDDADVLGRVFKLD